MSRGLRLGVPLALAMATAAPLLAYEPVQLGPIRLGIGGEASGSIAPRDLGFFNDADYGWSTLREARLALALEARGGRHVAVLGEVRSSNLDAPRVYALYVRVRPWADRAFDLQAGLVPPVFGSFPRRRYGPDNPLIGMPLGYQYRTTIRAEAAPATVDELLRFRGGGWRVQYRVGHSYPGPGLALASALRWDTGVQARVGSGPLELSAALTQGSLSRPLVEDDNGGKQVSARLAWRPRPSFAFGASTSRGEYAHRDLTRALPRRDGGFLQNAWGADFECSRDLWLIRGEAIWSGWDSPIGADPLRARALTAEGRYKVAPGVWIAARGDHLAFSRVTGSAGRLTWDAPVWRVEAGVGYALRRNLLLKAVWQHNRRDGGRLRRQSLTAAQILYWF